MADSDDEYDRKRRDKFRGERGAAEGSSYRSSDRREERSRGREEWSERYLNLFGLFPNLFLVFVTNLLKNTKFLADPNLNILSLLKFLIKLPSFLNVLLL